MGCGLPDWRGLAEGVVQLLPRKPGPPLGAISAALSRGEQPPPDPNALLTLKADVLKQEDPLRSMRYVKCDDELDLSSLVCRCLYGRPITLTETALEIPALERVKRICCFKYDDILDRSFAEAGRKYVALFPGDRIRLEARETLIFYPHGFLPDPKRRSFAATDNIVLSEDDYFDLYRSPYAWANMIQLTLLLNYTALFVGCSLLDPNIRRLLDIAGTTRPQHRHYAFFRNPYDREHAPWFQRNYASAFRVVRERLLDSLGVAALWVREHSEIAVELRKLQREDA
jgi:SIR2-like domain